MSDRQSENSQEVEPLSGLMPLAVAQQLHWLNTSVWADEIEGMEQPDRKKGKSDGNHVWTDEVSVIVQVYIGKNDKC